MSTTTGASGASGATGIAATGAPGSTGASGASGASGATGSGQTAAQATLSGLPLDAIGLLSTGDPTGLYTVEILQNGVATRLEVQGNQGRSIAFQARLRELLDLVRSVGKPPGTAAAAAEASITPANEAAAIAALQARVKTLEAEVVALGGKVPATPTPVIGATGATGVVVGASGASGPLPPVFTVKTPATQVAGIAFTLSGTYGGTPPTGIELAVDGGAFATPVGPVIIGSGAWSCAASVAMAGTHAITARDAGNFTEEATTGGFTVTPAPV